MMKGIGNFVVALAVCACAAGARAQVTIETVTVGNAGNTPDTRYETPGYGGVDYIYKIAKFEVTAGQYTEFLNAVANEDTYGLYNPSMWTSSYGCKIERTGSSPNYSYSVAADWADRPVNFVSWGDAGRFSNWLHNGQPTGAQDLTTTEGGSYHLNGATTTEALMLVVRNPDATWVIPSEDEWYKAAYHKNDGVTGNYWDHPTQSNTAPSAQVPPGTDMTNGSANYYRAGYVDPTHYRTEVGAYDAKPSDSPYGTFDQGGNVWEWNEAVFYGSYRGVRGGSFNGSGVDLHAGFYGYSEPTYDLNIHGFRVAEVSEPGPVCGDGTIEDGEECDDNNTDDGDGCSSTCAVEDGFICQGEPSVCFPSDIPTVSGWGLVAMALLVLTAGTLVLARRRVVIAH